MFDNTETKQITVLGKTFDSEEERRTYFREELRKHLPELKKMEGFPIGEDDDIVSLSDPPYYTACPNPWLNDFITQWEEEKKQLENDGKRSSNFKVDEPYAADVSEGKNNPIYNAHSYHTKVPHPAIMRFILHYTEPGDIIFDGFAGTGMTGVAAQICELPSLELKHKIDDEFINFFGSAPKWGERHAICSDLSTVASFIAHNYNKKHDLDEIENLSNQIIKSVNKECGWVYETFDENGKGIINYTVWSDVFLCSSCNNEIVFFEEGIDKVKNSVKKQFECPSCNSIQTKKTITKAKITYFDSALGESVTETKKVPVLIHYIRNGKRFQKIPDSRDLEKIDKINQLKIPYWHPISRMPDGDESRRNDRDGITHFNHFYTKRNLYVLSCLLNKILDSNSNSILLIFNSISQTLTSKLVRYNLGKRGNGTLNGTLYISSLIAEANVIKTFTGKVSDVKKAITHLNKTNVISQGSSTQLSNLKDNSIDYIFTDPPFGANFMYSELNFLWESWLKVLTNNSKEAIENKTQLKNVLVYQDLMAKCFMEFYQKLKPGKWMTVEFSNTSAAIWNGIQTAIQSVGFVISNLSSIDKQQGSFQAVTTVTAVKQDLVISCYKPSSEFDEKFKQHQNSGVAVWDFVEEHLHHLPIHLTSGNSTTAIIERSPKILFDRLIAFYVQKGLPVPMDASKFQIGLRERFVERDGMFFTNEQVQEYDKKKKENPEFIQLSILVSSEQDGVLWLKNVFTETPLTYQDIQPQWMQALAGVRKGDVIPELATILEENFLKDKSGKWYTPDLENEADLDLLRNKRLIKQFEEYKAEAANPKGKIKEVRVEALRAGFKQCYQDKDFKTIVQIGDRIPNNLLMEDEVLLQFYDIASSRV